jgi:L-alanine-DL-glutamate epimerase-like enolase superfamily enzyme
MNAPSELTIERIETVAIREQLPREFKGSFYSMTHRSTVITRVYTAGGIVGEAYVGDEDGALTEIQEIVKNEIAPQVIGLDALNTGAVWRAGFPATFDILRDRRLGLVALAGVDAAVWDAVGKHLDVPLWKLWGGAHDKRQIIAIGGYYNNVLGTIEQEIADYRSLGLAGVKFKVSARSPKEDAARVAAAREAAGDDFIIAVDANQGYTVPDAVEFSRRVADLDVRWFEEPVRWANDRRALRDVRFRAPLEVCAGQSEFSPAGCRDLMEAGAVDVCNFDSSWSGGPTVWLRAAAIAHTYDVRIAHHEEPQISSHLLASQDNSAYVECFHPDRDPFWWNLISTPRDIRDGWLHLGDGAGFGWELDDAYVGARVVAE